jgi:hypothetical protein
MNLRVFADPWLNRQSIPLGKPNLGEPAQHRDVPGIYCQELANIPATGSIPVMQFTVKVRGARKVDPGTPRAYLDSGAHISLGLERICRQTL